MPPTISATIMVAVSPTTSQVRRSLRAWPTPRKTCSWAQGSRERECISNTYAGIVRLNSRHSGLGAVATQRKTTLLPTADLSKNFCPFAWQNSPALSTAALSALFASVAMPLVRLTPTLYVPASTSCTLPTEALAHPPKKAATPAAQASMNSHLISCGMTQLTGCDPPPLCHVLTPP